MASHKQTPAANYPYQMKTRFILLVLALAALAVVKIHLRPVQIPELPELAIDLPTPQQKHARETISVESCSHHGNCSHGHSAEEHATLSTANNHFDSWPASVVEHLLNKQPDKARAIRHIRKAVTFEDYATLSLEDAARLINYTEGVLSRPEELSPPLCWSHSVAPAYRRAFENVRSLAFTENDQGLIALPAFQGDDRWTFTAPDGGTGNNGTPVTIRWSFVPDGTTIPNGDGNNTGASDLIARLNAAYGSPGTPGDLTSAPWFTLFAEAFDYWAQITGNVYIYEPNDDGAVMINFSNFSSPRGVVGVRGDVRIGGTFIDGNSNTLAFNYFPNVGDMVIDTADNANLGAGRQTFFKNVIAHEHGHGLGISHVCPVDRTKLMEPFATSSFVGPQFDDMLTAQELYGDPLERNGNNRNNNTIGTANNLGQLNGSFSANNLSIGSGGDVDLFRFQVSGARALNVSVTPTTQGSYLEGIQNNNGSCSAGTLFDPRIRQNLRLRVIAPDGQTVLASSDSGNIGQAEQLSNVQLTQANVNYYIEVSGGSENSGSDNNAQIYDLDLQLIDANPIQLGNLTVTSESFNPANNAPDPDELITISINIDNQGSVAATNGSITLSGSSALSIQGNPTQSLPSIPPAGFTTVDYVVSISGSCGDQVILSYALSTSLGSDVINRSISLGSLGTVIDENFDSNAVNVVPAGFSQSSGNSVASWRTVNSESSSSPISVRTDASSSTNSAFLQSEVPFIAQPDSELRFDHNYNIENTYDGGVLELSINGGPWQEWTTVGGSYSQNGYDTAISTGFSSPIGGQQAWSGNSGGFITTIAQFPTAAANQAVRLRWHMASDSSVDSDGWAIDNIVISGYTCLEATLPTLSITAIDPVASEFDTSNTAEFTITSDQTVSSDLNVNYTISGTATEGTDYNALSGTATISSGNDISSVIITATSDSDVEGDEEVMLTLQNSLGYDIETGQAKATIEDLPFDNYRAENFGSAVVNIADTEDFDFDGIANLLEYAFRLDPTQTSTSPVTISQGFDGDNIQLKLTYSEDTKLPDISYTVETSPDLNPDSWTQADVVISRGISIDGLQTVTATISSSTDARFMRVRVERITP